MIELSPGDTYDHDDYGRVRVTGVLQRLGKCEIDAEKQHVEAGTIEETHVEFENLPTRGYGPDTVPLSEFLDGIDT